MLTKAVSCALVLLGLVACDKPLSDPPVRHVSADAPAVERPFSPLPDPSVPSANTVLSPPVTGTAKDESANRPKGDLSAAEESTAMPKAGQANNHSSTALDPTKPASAP